MSGGAPKEVFALLAPRFEEQTDNKVEFTYAVITELREKLSAGATADVLVLPTAVLDSLAKDGKVRAACRSSCARQNCIQSYAAKTQFHQN
jgi:ABC-type molybdate transport system substrate-binding protein